MSVEGPLQLLGDFAVDVVENHLVEAEDGVHRRSQLVTDIGEKVGLVAARRLELSTLGLQFGRPLADAIFQRPVQLLELGQRPLPVVDADLQRAGHPVEGGGELTDLVARLYRDLLFQGAGGDLLGLLGELLDGIGDSP
jgi:hypothetical protein